MAKLSYMKPGGEIVVEDYADLIVIEPSEPIALGETGVAVPHHIALRNVEAQPIGCQLQTSFCFIEANQCTIAPGSIYTLPNGKTVMDGGPRPQPAGLGRYLDSDTLPPSP